MKQENSVAKNPELCADWQSLMRAFINVESDESTVKLLKYTKQIFFGLHDFLKEHVGITEEISLIRLSQMFTDTRICEYPEKKLGSVIADLIKEIAPHAVNVSSPYFVGHMTSAIPFFMVYLKAIVAALNQNVVKLETSKVVSVLEKQLIAKLHRMIYGKNDSFYNTHVQNSFTTLGSFTEDGTLANLTALWVARNTSLPPKEGFEGIEKEGLVRAYQAHGIERSVVLVSRMGHYSIRKAGGLLGIGNKNVIAIDVDKNHHIDIDLLLKTIKQLNPQNSKTKILAVIGIAGATETGTVDPLTTLAEICAENGIYFHVDAAWGGPTLMSEKYRHLLQGIELADSITIDGHKQFYMPMSCGMVYFKDPKIMDTIAYHAKYINRIGSVDLGIKSLAGSREANSLILDSAFKIMGRKGYALLIEHGIELARLFAEEIERRPNFQLVTPPELNILTYRLCPEHIQKKLIKATPEQKKRINQRLNKINLTVQREQRAAGKSFVSRTALSDINGDEIGVLRCVLANPLTNLDILNEVLDEQEELYKEIFTQKECLKLKVNKVNQQ